jgi:hypothetical protein
MATRSDYVLVATCIWHELEMARATQPENAASRAVAHSCENIARSLSQRFKDENPRFDHILFLTACGVHTP